MKLLLFSGVTILLGLLVFVEFSIDAKILRHPKKYNPLLVKFKHWFYNAPRLLTWFLLSVPFYNRFPFWAATGVIVITVTANAFLFRFWHDWLYQWLIMVKYWYGKFNFYYFIKAFDKDSDTPIKEENSFWDKVLPDTSANRVFCFQIFTVLTIIQIIFKLY